MLLSNFGYALVPFIMVAGTLYTIWWYVVIHQQAAVEAAVTGVQQLGTPGLVAAGGTPAEEGPGNSFYWWFWGITAVCALMQFRHYWNFTADRMQIIRLLTSSTMPLGILTVVVLAVILFRICTPTEAPALRPFGAFLLAGQARTPDPESFNDAVLMRDQNTH